MKKKNAKNFKYEGFGFPVILEEVELREIDGQWVPKLDVRNVAEEVIKELPFQKERFSGAQIKFIRNYFEMSLRKFADEVVFESHTAVAKWEKEINRMDINFEIMLRLYIHEKVSVKTKKEEKEFFEDYKELRGMKYLEKKPAPINLAAG